MKTYNFHILDMDWKLFKSSNEVEWTNTYTGSRCPGFKNIVGVKIPIFLGCSYALEKFGKSFNHWVRTLWLPDTQAEMQKLTKKRHTKIVYWHTTRPETAYLVLEGVLCWVFSFELSLLIILMSFVFTIV